LLLDACKRRKLSFYGSKPILKERLFKSGFKATADIRRLAAKYRADGVDGVANTNLSTKAPH